MPSAVARFRKAELLASLRKLRSIEILSAAKLTDIENEMSGLKVCYELTPGRNEE